MHAAARPDDLAVVDGDRRLSLAEFNALVNQYGHVLRSADVQAGEKVLWVGENSAEVVAVNHAARKVGAVCVPMNYRLAPHEAQYVIDNCDAVVVLFDIQRVTQLEPIRSQCGRVREWLAFRLAGATAPTWARDLDAEAAAASADEPGRAGDDPAAGTTMIYTSGTTGKPKGTVRRATSNAADSLAFIRQMGRVPSGVYLSTGPLYHSAPLGFMLLVQSLGGSVVIQRHCDPEEWLRLVEQHRVTTSFSAPTPIRRVVDLPDEVRSRYDTSSMQRLIANAVPWPFEPKKKYVERINTWSLIEVYGSTELGVNTILLPDDQMRKPGSCGKPIAGVELQLIDDDGNEVTTPGEPGEVFVRSAGTFAAYSKDPDKYVTSQRGDFLSVGDVAYWDVEGYLYICDRKSDMIISGGVNIYPVEIEAVLVPPRRSPTLPCSASPTTSGANSYTPSCRPTTGRRWTRQTSPRSAAGTWPDSRCPARWSGSTRSRAAHRARSRSASYASPTGPAAARESVEPAGPAEVPSRNQRSVRTGRGLAGRS